MCVHRGGARPRARRGASSAAPLLLALCGIAASAHAQSADETAPLAGLVTEAENRNPEILRARHAVSAAHEVPSQAGSLPDPMISVSLQNVPFNNIALDASPMTGILLGVSQVLPFPGKLGRREEYAQATAITAQRDADLVRARVAFEVREAYWRLSFAERAYEITSKSERVINSPADAAVARFSVAMAPQQDVLQAEVAHSRVRANLERRRQEVVSARRALNGAVGRAPDAPHGKTQAPPRPPPNLDFDRLSHAVDQGNPVVVAARARVDAAERAIAEAKKDRLPDFQLGAGFRIRAAAQGDMTHGEDMFDLTLGMTLPVWLATKQNARVRETVELLAEAQEHVAAVELEAVTQLQQRLDAIERVELELRLNDREILPEANQALDASITDYQFARVGFVSVLRNWQTELDTELEYLRLLTERAQLLAAVEFLTHTAPGTAK
jgi:cobalt-zinc-cadmium efflux system outer membrane protein